MAKETTEQRIARLEEQVKALRDWKHDREVGAHLHSIGQRITDRLFHLGADKVDLKLIAKLNVALGIDVMPLTKAAPKKARKAAHPIWKKTKRP